MCLFHFLSNFLVSETNDLFKDYNLIYISRGICYVSEAASKGSACMSVGML